MHPPLQPHYPTIADAPLTVGEGSFPFSISLSSPFLSLRILTTPISIQPVKEQKMGQVCNKNKNLVKFEIWGCEDV